MSFQIVAYRGRSTDYMGTLSQKDGTPYVLQPADRLRLRIGRGTDVLFLDLTSGVPSFNGSFIAITSMGTQGPPAAPASYMVRLTQGDLAEVDVGTYDAEVSVL